VEIGVLGGGPAGLYFALLTKAAHPGHGITVVERNPAGATYGWGVVFSDRTLASFREADVETYEAITDAFVIWDAIDIRVRGELVRCGGQVFSGISRRLLLRLLQQRCADLGVRLVFDEEFTGPERFEGADLVVAADGVRSPTRAALSDYFRPRLYPGRSKYIWFGTTLPLDSFTFMFKEGAHGLFQVHSYPFDGTTSTFIVETTATTWGRAGLDEADEQESLEFCESLFAEELRGHRLMSNMSRWLDFVTVKNRAWRRDNVVLVGDAAHTAHFSIGSGTKLAMEDAIALARVLDDGRPVDEALAHYEAERRPPIARFQHAAAQSQSYFENAARYIHLDPHQFAFNLLSRSGRMDYDSLRIRDPRFVTNVEARIGPGGAAAPARLAVPPALTPLALRDLVLQNRVVAEISGPDDLRAASATGAGLLLARVVPVAPDGRITPEDPNLFVDGDLELWRRAITPQRSPGPAVGVRVGHAGPRGATIPRGRGLDRPLPDSWPLIAPSPVPYAPWSLVPREMDEGDMSRVKEAFISTVFVALDVGFDVVVIDMAHAYLLAAFLSPATNSRSDGFGGELAARMRFPLEVFDAVRARWPEVPLGVRIAATEWSREGTKIGDAVAIVRELGERGCDLVEVTAGGLHDSRPRYDPYHLPSYADVIRNETGLPTLATGQIATVDDVHTLVGAARADLGLLLVTGGG
jgi:anthraniloyl-CoA monooxygenase